jgi:cyclase
MIAIVDYGVGNLASVVKAFRAVGHEAQLVREPARLGDARAIVLPGVGHFGHCAREFNRYSFGPAIADAHRRGVPLLGICVGMQLLFEGSEEADDAPGLGLLRGRVRRMRGVPRLPQIGWNRVAIRGLHPWLDVSGDRYFYFLHSYAAEPRTDLTLGAVNYGGERAAIVGADGILGVQFHPEKSGAAGLELLRGFAERRGSASPSRDGGLGTLAKRIVPCLDVKDGRVVKGTRFVELRDAGDPVDLARRYDEQGADELVFLDITASAEKRRTVVDLASRVADVLFIPFTVGGGIRDADEAGEILRVGADKVALNSAAVRDPSVIAKVAGRFGSQAMVLAIDARKRDGGWEVVIDGGRTPTGRDALEWAKDGVDRGAGEILLTSMETDGTKLGFDIALTEAVASAVDVPVIASGGASGPDDFVTLFQRTGADAGLAASIFHYDETTVSDVKAALARAGIAVRPPQTARVS